jgi:nucleoside-diphosphate-sugar epimerase
MRVAILGASGFIGRNLMLSLPNDWQVTAFFNTAVDFPKWAEINHIKEDTIFIQQDLSKEFILPYPDTVSKYFDLVISLIGDTRKLSKDELPMSNFYSDPVALIQFFKRFTCDKFLYFSSGCVYEGHSGLVAADTTKNIHPFTPYAIAKRTSEMLLNYWLKDKFLKRYLNVRFFGAYGPYQRDNKITSKLIRTFCIENKKHIELTGTGNNLIDAMYVQDAIDWILLAVKQKFENATIDFGVAHPITIKELVLRTAVVCGIDHSIIDWDVTNVPKEDYYFGLGNEHFTVTPPFNYKFKYQLENGIALTRDWLLRKEASR